jgi:hypothetical protein
MGKKFGESAQVIALCIIGAAHGKPAHDGLTANDLRKAVRDATGTTGAVWVVVLAGLRKMFRR